MMTPALPAIDPPALVRPAQTVVACPAGQSAKVDVVWNTAPIQYDFSKSTKDLNHFHLDTNNPYGTNVHTDAGGITNGELLVKSSVSTKMQSFPAIHQTCLWVNAVQINILVKPTVYIASDYPQGSCKHNAIAEHEMKHVKTDQRVVQDFSPQIKAAVTAAVQKIGMVGPKADSDVRAVQTKINAYVQKALDGVTAQMHASRRQRQQQIDTLAEYQRVDRVCK